MSYQKLLQNLNNRKKGGFLKKRIYITVDELQLVKEAVEKQIAAEPLEFIDSPLIEIFCPKCNNPIGVILKGGYIIEPRKHCDYCGQTIDHHK